MSDSDAEPLNGSHTLQWNLETLTEALQMMFQNILLESSPSIREGSKVRFKRLRCYGRICL